MKKHLLALDNDGTLSDTKQVLTDVCVEVAGKLGLPLTKEEAENIYFTWDKKYFGWGKNLETQRLIYEKIYLPKFFEMVHEQKNLDRVEFFPGVEKVLDELYQMGIKLSVVTSSTGNRAKDILVRKNLLSKFEGGIVSIVDNNFKDKPSTEALQLLSEKNNVNPENIIMVDDTVGGIMMGKNFGSKTVGVGYGYNDVKDVINAKPDEYIEKVSDIKKLPYIIEKLVKSR